MKNPKSILKWFVILPLIIVAVNSCKKDKKEEPISPVTPAGTVNLTPEKTSVSPFEVIYFTNTGQGILNANSYAATINGTTVTLDKINDKLWLVLPDIAPGTYALSGTVEGSSININFTVNALPVIADPNAYYNNWQTQFLASRQATALLGDSLVQAGLISATALANDQNVISQIYDSANYYWNQLSPQERISAAGLMELDKPILDNLELLNVFSRAEDCFGKKYDAEQIIYDIDSDEEKAEKQSYKLLYLKCLSTVYSEKYNQWDYALAKSFVKHKNANIVKQLIFASFNYLGQILEKMYESNVQKELAKVITMGDELNAKFMNLKSINRTGISHIDCTNNIAREIMPEITFESIKESDVSNPNSIPKNYATSLSALRNDFINRFNSMLPAPLQMVPEFSNTSKTTVYNRDISIANISNSNVTSICQMLNNKLMLEFHTTQTTTQNFTFDMVYTGPEVGTVSTNISATLTINPCDGNLNVTETRSGKTITAAATGGTLPYQFQFVNSYTIQAFSTNNSCDLVYNGDYSVIVKDANGCIDTVKSCVNDVTIDNFVITPQNSWQLIWFSYHSPLGLLPEFLTYQSSTDTYQLTGWNVTSSNSIDYPSHINDICNLSGYGSSVPGFHNYSGTVTDRIVKFRLQGGTTSPTNISFRLTSSSCGASWQCNNPYYGPRYMTTEYSVNW